MTVTALPPCETEEEDEYRAELSALIQEYDKLFERCMKRLLTYDEQKELDGLYEFLSLKENEYWDGCSDYIVEMINERVGFDFPMLRTQMGVVPDQQQKEN